MSFDPTPFDYLAASIQWIVVFGVFLGITVLTAAFTSLVIRRSLKPVGQNVAAGLKDVSQLSARRTWALALLTFKESIRRKALLVFVVFALLFMFGGWFLSNTGANQQLEHQVKVYVSFVLKAITWLTFPVVLLISSWGLPEDIRLRSLHTVVTKPARRLEIVLGRMLGAVVLATLILAVMSSVAYFWTLREVRSQVAKDFSTTVDGQDVSVTRSKGGGIVVDFAGGNVEATSVSDLRRQSESAYAAYQAAMERVPAIASRYLMCRVPVLGSLSFTDREGNPSNKGINVGDIWEFRDYIEGTTKQSAIWEFQDITPERVGDSFVMESRFEAFRTHKGEIDTGLLGQFFFLNNLRTQAAHALAAAPHCGTVGLAVEQGDFHQASQQLAAVADGLTKRLRPTGQEYAQMSSAFGRFEDLLEPFQGKNPDAHWIADALQAARHVVSQAGESNRTGLAQEFSRLADLWEQHADELNAMFVDLVVPHDSFEVKEFRGNLTRVGRKITYLDSKSEEKTVDLFDDLVHGGRLRIRVVCHDAGQYLGMARPDLFIRLPDRPFASGFFKAVFGIWLMLVLVAILGVTASCFVNGAVATLLTFTVFLVGTQFHSFLDELVTGKMEGSGAIEATIRIVQHKNPKVELDEIVSEQTAQIVQAVDSTIGGGVWLVYHIVPNFNVFRLTEYVANGFDVPWNSALVPSLAMALAYILPCLLIGYYSLRLRELEAK